MDIIQNQPHLKESYNMSRSGYSDDGENYGLWRGIVASAIRGKRGQKLFIDLAQALDEMPEKKLISNSLKTEDGSFCTLGVLGEKRGIDLKKINPEDAERVAKEFDIATPLAQEIVYMNDEYFCDISPEDRWTVMRKWVEENIRKPKDEK